MRIVFIRLFPYCVAGARAPLQVVLPHQPGWRLHLSIGMHGTSWATHHCARRCFRHICAGAHAFSRANRAFFPSLPHVWVPLHPGARANVHQFSGHTAASCLSCLMFIPSLAVTMLCRLPSSLSACLLARPMIPSERDCLRDCVTLRRDLSSSRARCLRRSYVLAMTLTWSVVGRRFARSAALGTEKVAECRGTCHMVSRTWRRGAEKRTARRDQIAPGSKFPCWCLVRLPTRRRIHACKSQGLA